MSPELLFGLFAHTHTNKHVETVPGFAVTAGNYFLLHHFFSQGLNVVVFPLVLQMFVKFVINTFSYF